MASLRQGSGSSVTYEILLKGYLPPEWSDWFAGMAVSCDDKGNTLLTGPIADQAALHGLLDRVRDLGIPLLAVRRVGEERA